MDLNNLDLSDPQVQEALRVLQQDHKYNSRLKEFLDSAYDWQKKAVTNTAKYRENGIICGNQMGKSEIACAIAACHLTGHYPDWWDGKRWDEPVDILLAGVNSEHNKDV